MRYPATRTDDGFIEERFGIEIPDRYRWLENVDDASTLHWVAEQNAVTERFLAGIPDGESIRSRLRHLLDFEKISAPVRRGGRVFMLWNDGLRPQPVLCVLDGDQPRVLVDPLACHPTDDTRSIIAFTPSPDAGRVAYGIASGGSDWTEWRVADVATGEELPDRLHRVRFSSPAWSADGAALYYAALDESDVPRGLRHAIGDPGSDPVVFERAPGTAWRFQPVVSEDGRWLVLYLFDQTGGPNGLAVVDLAGGPSVVLPDAFRARFAFAGSAGSLFWIMTDLDAPRGRVLAIEPTKPTWREIVPEREETLQWVVPKGNRLVAGYLADACSLVRTYELDGTAAGDVELPGVGWAGTFGGDRSDPETPFLFQSFVQPPALHAYDAASNAVGILREPRLPFDPRVFVTSQRFVVGADGTQIPVFVTRRRDVERDGARPTLLWGYGGFGIPVVPFYWPLALAWMERGGVFAVACIRGGGEYGEGWHLAGSGPNKQNSFDDFVAVAEWLVADGYTSPEKLAVTGASNGGLLVGACITQRPELFAAAHIDMGLLDMMHIDRVPVGLAMSNEYGSMEVPEDVRRLLSYSPLHNVRAGVRYPATLLTTGNHDELVRPSNSYKFAAAMQAAQAGDAPVLLRVELDAGHGTGKPTRSVLAEQADVLTFLLRGVGELST